MLRKLVIDMRYLAFDFSPADGHLIIYRPRDIINDSHDDDLVYEHFFNCIQKDYYFQCIPDINTSKLLFGDLVYDVKE